MKKKQMEEDHILRDCPPPHKVRHKSPQPCPTLCDAMDCSLAGSSIHGDSRGKNTGVGYHALLQGSLPTQGWNPHLLCFLHWQAGSTAIWEAFPKEVLLEGP